MFNKNARKTSYILSREEEILYGPGFIFESLLGYKYKLSAQSFFQINPIMMEKLLERAFELLPIKKDDKVVDVYSGTGVIGIVASKFSQQVVAIEGNRQAVLDSRNNAFYNKSTMKTIHGDATEVLEEMAIHQEPVDIVIMDPSREGSTERFLDALNRLEPREILYISCYPPSLARDLDYLLKANKYQINHIVPVDMFPFTQHVECVVLITRK